MSHEPLSESVTNAVRVVSDGYEQKLATLQTGFETAHELWVQERDRAIQMEGALASEKRAVKAQDETFATLTAERDAAIAHDRQPYPTAWAYEQVCKARTELAERLEKVEAERDALRTALTSLQMHMPLDCQMCRLALELVALGGKS